MKKHIADQPRTHERGARTKAFTRIEREEQPSEQTVKAQKAPRTRGKSRTAEFLRIERGERA